MDWCLNFGCAIVDVGEGGFRARMVEAPALEGAEDAAEVLVPVVQIKCLEI